MENINNDSSQSKGWYNKINFTNDLDEIIKCLSENHKRDIFLKVTTCYGSCKVQYSGEGKKNKTSKMIRSVGSSEGTRFTNISDIDGQPDDDEYRENGDIEGDDFDEYKEGLASELTVGDLASMSSGMKWSEKYYSVINITSESYFTDDLRSVVLRQGIIDKPGKRFRYSSGDTQLLGMVIEKATGTTLTNYLSEKFWQPMGAENSALWQIDSEKSGMEKAYCCIASTARDFARFGKLYINNGKWNDEIILDPSYIDLSINPVFEDSPYYGYGWWLYNYEGKKVFTMNGHRGQFVISFPDENIIIVRQGEFNNKVEEGKGTSDLQHYIAEGYKIASSIN